ncbi:MAG: thiamine-binding protein [Gammaproteobacteria bacterium]|nr:thiamine-binding protein [Gammaproteobacteria bacterium]MDH5239610.1 thiamine-binding protein [Gammaproteobacteria bacterium]MDH5262654.1 thiamine-binding protein [Gammaproteobacteria bacterium]MDH5582397.1 thiamine-binding protein [Gammaproteobacteria bacterium]
MKVAVDISLYPLDADFIPPIKNIIKRLAEHSDVEIEYNRMSTQLRGEYDVVMPVLMREIRTTFEDVPKAVFTIKILNNPVN